jgi:hypothetical protein
VRNNRKVGIPISKSKTIAIEIHTPFRGILTWIVGFTSDNLHLSRAIGSIPEFVSQAFFRSVNCRPDTISKALILSCASPFLMDHTGIIFIEKSHLSIFSSVKEFAISTPHMPWGIPLSHCPTCKTNWYLSSYNFSSSKCDINCTRCGSEGFSDVPPGCRVVSLDHHDLKRKSGHYFFGSFPRLTEMTVKWTKSGSEPLKDLELKNTHGSNTMNETLKVLLSYTRKSIKG